MHNLHRKTMVLLPALACSLLFTGCDTPGYRFGREARILQARSERRFIDDAYFTEESDAPIAYGRYPVPEDPEVSANGGHGERYANNGEEINVLGMTLKGISRAFRHEEGLPPMYLEAFREVTETALGVQKIPLSEDETGEEGYLVEYTSDPGFSHEGMLHKDNEWLFYSEIDLGGVTDREDLVDCIYKTYDIRDLTSEYDGREWSWFTVWRWDDKNDIYMIQNPITGKYTGGMPYAGIMHMDDEKLQMCVCVLPYGNRESGAGLAEIEIDKMFSPYTTGQVTSPTLIKYDPAKAEQYKPDTVSGTMIPSEEDIMPAQDPGTLNLSDVADTPEAPAPGESPAVTPAATPERAQDNSGGPTDTTPDSGKRSAGGRRAPDSLEGLSAEEIEEILSDPVLNPDGGD